MKPLPPAPLTETDDEIWSSVGWMYEKSGVHVWGACFEISLESDRRDAELMLFGAEARCGLYHWTATRGRIAVFQASTGEWVEVGGMLPAAGDITHCV
jgi:hypothetical protein